jgi:hypothetical protein
VSDKDAPCQPASSEYVRFDLGLCIIQLREHIILNPWSHGCVRALARNSDSYSPERYPPKRDAGDSEPEIASGVRFGRLPLWLERWKRSCSHQQTTSAQCACCRKQTSPRQRINVEHILAKTKAVVVPFRRSPKQSALADPSMTVDDADLA